MPKAVGRLYSRTLDLRLPQENGFHKVTVSLIYDFPSRRLAEIAFVRRGKSGQALDHMLTHLGIMLSRALQNRDPDTGAEMEADEGVPA